MTLHSSAHVLEAISLGLKEAGVGVFSLHYLSREKNPSAIASEVYTAALEWGGRPYQIYESSAYGQSTNSMADALENLLERNGWLAKYPIPPGLCPCTPEEKPWSKNTAES